MSDNKLKSDSKPRKRGPKNSNNSGTKKSINDTSGPAITKIEKESKEAKEVKEAKIVKEIEITKEVKAIKAVKEKKELRHKGGILKISSGSILPTSTQANSGQKKLIADSFEELQRPSSTNSALLQTDKKSKYEKYLLDSIKISEQESFLNKLKNCETLTQKVFEEKKKDKQWILDFCSRGPNNISPELLDQLDQLLCIYFEFLSKQFIDALEYKIIEKFWSFKKKLIDLFQMVLGSSSSNTLKIKPTVNS